MDKIKIITESIKTALQSLELEVIDKSIELEHPVQEEHGDYSSNAALKLIGKVHDNKIKNPRDLAESIKAILDSDPILKDIVEKVEIAGPGFINFTLNQEFLISVLGNLISEGKKFGSKEIMKGKKIMVEYAHPNPFKAFHIGHLRGTILGDVICRLIESQGAEVIRTNYQGDVGMHIAKCIWALKDVDPSQYPETNDEKVALLGQCYSKGSSAYEDNSEAKKEIIEINKEIYSKEDKGIYDLWEMGKKWSLDKFDEIFKRLDTHFDRSYMESEMFEDSKKIIAEALDKGILEKSDGAVIFNGKPYKLDTRVFLNSDGLPTYEGKELALAHKEFTDFGTIDLCIHNVAVEQISFFKVTFKVEELLNPDLFKDKQYHNAYEFVDVKGGKMSSRKGDVVLGNDVINQTVAAIQDIIEIGDSNLDKDTISEMLGVAAVKYSFLKISPFKRFDFDVKESVDTNGNSGPYLQYTHARCKSVLAKAGQDIKIDPADLEEYEFKKEESHVMRWLYRYPEVVQSAAEDYAPQYLCTYLYDLAQRFNGFYNKHSILKSDSEKVKKLRIAITAGTAQVLKNGLELLGIEAPDKV